MRQPRNRRKAYWEVVLEASLLLYLMYRETAEAELDLWIPNLATIRSSHYQLSKQIITLRIKTVA